MGPPTDAHRAAALPDTMETLAWHLKAATWAARASDNHNQQPGPAPRAGASTADAVRRVLRAVGLLARPSLFTGQQSNGVCVQHGVRLCFLAVPHRTSIGPGPSAR